MTDPVLSASEFETARPHYEALKKALDAAVGALGRDVVIGMVTTMLLRLYTDAGRPASLTLAAMTGALAGQLERVSVEDIRRIKPLFIATRERISRGLAR